MKVFSFIITILSLVQAGRDLHQTLADADAICYARRYPDLYQGFCHGDDALCHIEALEAHFLHYGESFDLIWGCRDNHVVTAQAVQYTSESGDEVVPELHILVFETDPKKAASMKLAAQSVEAGLNLSVFGSNVAFEGFGTKWEVVQPVLKSLHPDTLVAIVDGRDVLLNIHKEDPNHGHDIVD
eukprot:scaffold42060_cov183-Amphora_coffeaeformis.AAC.1